MNNVDDCNNSTADEKNAREKNISEIGAGLVETFLNIGMTEEELRIFICKEKGMNVSGLKDSNLGQIQIIE